MASPLTLLQVRQLRFGWPGQPLFQGLDLDLPAGLSLVTGDDGCGKTSLLRLLAGEWSATSGDIRLHGSGLTPAAPGWREQVFWIDPQTDAHDETPAGDVLHTLLQRYPNASADALAELIEGFDLQPHLTKPLFMLSAGSRRKVWLSGAFAAGTPVTLIDQPFAALDGPAQRFLRELLQDVADHPSRAWLIGDHSAPPDVALASTLQL